MLAKLHSVLRFVIFKTSIPQQESESIIVFFIQKAGDKNQLTTQ